jgi:hypothetical protein
MVYLLISILFNYFFCIGTSDVSTHILYFVFNKYCTDDPVFNFVQQRHKNLENNYDLRRCNEAGKPGLYSRKGQEIFLFSTASIPALESTQPPTQLVSAVLSPGICYPDRETDHSLPSSAEVKNSLYVFMAS